MRGDKCYFCDKKLERSHPARSGEKGDVKILVNLCELCDKKLEWLLGFAFSTKQRKGGEV